MIPRSREEGQLLRVVFRFADSESVREL